jgi:two-component sensor histidine kinase
MSNNHHHKVLSELNDSFEQFIAVIHSFSVQVNRLSQENEVYWLITKELAPKLELLDCVIYEVNTDKRELAQIAAVGEKINLVDEIQNRLVLKFGEGHVGMCYIKAESFIIDDTSLSPNYIKDVSPAGSEIVVPIIISNEVVAVISSEAPVPFFYTEIHQKIFEVIAIISAGAIRRIREHNSLSKVKSQLEEVVLQKSSDLNRVIDVLSNQYSELKYQHEKMELLIQEVHHRVNNNLQIISSLLSLYASNADGNEANTLKSIKNRVQAMALIHQNIYKSVEMSSADVEAYVRDLMNHLRSVDETGVQSVFHFQTAIKFINLNTLVPFGLLLVEIFSKWMSECQNTQHRNVEFKLVLQKESMNRFVLTIQDDLTRDFKFSKTMNDESISSILISALVDQLEGSLSTHFEEYNRVEVVFSEQ